MSESGRMRSPPLVEKFRRAKDNCQLQMHTGQTDIDNWQSSSPTNGKLLSLKRMFHEASAVIQASRCWQNLVQSIKGLLSRVLTVFTFSNIGDSLWTILLLPMLRHGTAADAPHQIDI